MNHELTMNLNYQNSKKKCNKMNYLYGVCCLPGGK